MFKAVITYQTLIREFDDQSAEVKWHRGSNPPMRRFDGRLISLITAHL